MKYIIKVIKIIFAVFCVATAGMLILAFIAKKNAGLINQAFGYYFGLSYMIILVCTLVALIIGIAVGIFRNIKKNRWKKFLRSALTLFAVGVGLVIVHSLIKYRTFFSTDIIYIPLVFILIPSFVYALEAAEK
ncbi:MAG: hypothetical protein K0R90_290 [Oscillospiraceae bacterium]|nr:hypothetical protein [Oscillospiraceae bacterium]